MGMFGVVLVRDLLGVVKWMTFESLTFFRALLSHDG